MHSAFYGGINLAFFLYPQSQYGPPEASVYPAQNLPHCLPLPLCNPNDTLQA